MNRKSFAQFCAENSSTHGDCEILFRFSELTLEKAVPDVETLPSEVRLLNTRIQGAILEFNEINDAVQFDDALLQDARRACDAVLDWAWEKINVGIWSLVPVKYRLLIAYHRLLESVLKCIHYRRILQSPSSPYQVLDALIDMLESLDNGLIMSPDFCGGVLTKAASYLHNELIVKNIATIEHESENCSKFELSSCVQHYIELSGNFHSSCDIKIPYYKHTNRYVERHEELDIFDFESQYLRNQIPVIITNACQHWPCLTSDTRKWSFETLLRRIGFRTVPIEFGSTYTDENWSQKLVKFVDFLHSQVTPTENRPVGYLAQHNLFEQIPELARDFAIPDYCAASKFDQDADENDAPVDINAWIGPAGTVSPLHTDPRDNMFVQVVGKKYVRIISSDVPEEQICALDGLQSNTSQVNLENPDPRVHSGFGEIDPQLVSEAVLGPGEMLLIPAGHWHFVKSLEPSISLSFWFN